MTRANDAYRFGDYGPGSAARATALRQGFNQAPDTSGMDNFVAQQQRVQANQDQFLHGIQQRQHENNVRVLESTALIAGAVVAWNHLGQHDGRQHQTYSRDGGQTYFVPKPHNPTAARIIVSIIFAVWSVVCFGSIGSDGATAIWMGIGTALVSVFLVLWALAGMKILKNDH
jgi:hypothetical protein